jgi:hypothetical protein
MLPYDFGGGLRSDSPDAGAYEYLPGSFDGWKATYFSPAEMANDAISGQTADPDGDGIPNLMEYAFGSNPAIAGDSAGMPVVSMPGSYLQVRFSLDATRSDLTYEVQASNDLVSWTTIARSPGGGLMVDVGGGSRQIEDTGSGQRTVTVHDATDAGSLKSRFLRLKIAKP